MNSLRSEESDYTDSQLSLFLFIKRRSMTSLTIFCPASLRPSMIKKVRSS